MTSSVYRLLIFFYSFRGSSEFTWVSSGLIAGVRARQAFFEERPFAVLSGKQYIRALGYGVDKHLDPPIRGCRSIQQFNTSISKFSGVIPMQEAYAQIRKPKTPKLETKPRAHRTSLGFFVLQVLQCSSAVQSVCPVFYRQSLV